MAKGFFNTLTSSKNADCAGIKAETHVDPFTIKVMNEVGIDVSNFVPKNLTLEMNKHFDIFITMGCGGYCPDTPQEKTIAWMIEDPKGKSLEKYREVREIIKNHIEKLIIKIV
jgi:arsenate reductase